MNQSTKPAETLEYATTPTEVSQQKPGAVVSFVVSIISTWRWAKGLIQQLVQWSKRTITGIGWLIIITTVLGLSLGILFGILEATVLGVIASLLIITAIPFLIGRGEYHVVFELREDRVVAGTQPRANLVVTNRSRGVAVPVRMDLPVGAGSLELQLPFLAKNQIWQQEIQLPVLSRGIIPIGPITTIKADPVGLLSNEIKWADVFELFVHPVTIDLPKLSAGFVRDLEGAPTSKLVDSDISFHTIREYAPGDLKRHIHWKSTAKIGKLMVRQFEETRRSRLLIVLSSSKSEYASADEYELAVSVAASLAKQAIKDGIAAELITGAEHADVLQTQDAKVTRISLIDQLSMLDELSGLSLGTSANLLNQAELVANLASGVSIVVLIGGSNLRFSEFLAAAKKFSEDAVILALRLDEYSEPGLQSGTNFSIANLAVITDLQRLLAKPVS